MDRRPPIPTIWCRAIARNAAVHVSALTGRARNSDGTLYSQATNGRRRPRIFSSLSPATHSRARAISLWNVHVLRSHQTTCLRELDCGPAARRAADAIGKVAAKFTADGDRRLCSRAVRREKNVSFDPKSLQNDEELKTNQSGRNSTTAVSCEGNRW